MNEIQENIARLEEAFAVEILKAKTRFIHLCLQAILPDELYKLAAADNQIPRCEAWAKEHGYYWQESPGATALMKGSLVVGLFQPQLVGDGHEKRCIFLAHIWGKPVSVAMDNPLIAQVWDVSNN